MLLKIIIFILSLISSRSKGNSWLKSLMLSSALTYGAGMLIDNVPALKGLDGWLDNKIGIGTVAPQPGGGTIPVPSGGSVNAPSPIESGIGAAIGNLTGRDMALLGVSTNGNFMDKVGDALPWIIGAVTLVFIMK